MRIFGHSFRITPYFWLIWILFAISQIDFRSLENLPQNLMLTGLLLPVVFGSLLWHELGHILFHRQFGAHNLETVFGAYGGRTSSDGDIGRRRRVFISMAGPIFTLIFLVAGVAVQKLVPGLEEPELVRRTLHLFIIFNFVWTIANVMPIFPMDCGWILSAIYPNSRILLSIVGIILSLLFVVFSVMTGRYAGAFVLGVLLYVNVKRLFSKAY